MSLRRLPLPVISFPWENTNASYLPNTQGIPVSSNVTMPDFVKLNTQQVPEHTTSSNVNPGENAFPQQMARAIHQSTTTDNSPNSFMNEGINTCRFQNPQANRNILPMRGNAEVGYQMYRERRAANSPTVARPQSNKHFASARSSRPVLNHPQSNGQIKAETDAKVNTDQSGSLKKIDGSFLSLGPESKIDTRSSSYFSCREISSKLEEAASSNFSTSQVRHARRSLSSQGQDMGVGFPNSQESGGGLSIPALYAGGFSNRNESEELSIASTELSSRPFHTLQTPEVNMQQNMVFMPSNIISSSVSDMDQKYGNIRGDQLAPSGAYSRSTTAFPLSGENKLSGLASQSDNCMGIATGTAPHQLHNMDGSQNLSMESILKFHLLRTGGNAVRHGDSGIPSAYEGSLDQAAHSNLLRSNNQFQPNSNCTAVAPTSGVFPKRLGVQGYIAQAPEGSSIPTDRSVQAASKYYKSLHDIPVRFCRDLRVPSTNGQSPAMPFLPRANYCGPLAANCPPRSSVPIQNCRPMSTTGQCLPVTKVNEVPQVREVLSRPSLKRGAIQTPPDATWVHRRKLTHKPTVSPSMSYQPVPPSMSYKPIPPSVSYKPKNTPAILPTAPVAHPPIPAISHIKWQGADEQPQPIENKCLICKRDLIFSPEGPVERPPIPPPVAVLPCGHTFHDHCLQKITPEDQSKSPPCIPCAIGEN